MAYDEISRKIILFGGYDGSSTLNDTWSFDGITWTNLTPILTTSPPALFTASMAYDEISGTIILFSGETGSGLSQDTWSFDGTTWTDLTSTLITSPPVRGGASMAYDKISGTLILFGGYSNGSVLLNDTWSFDGTTWTNLNLTNPPSPRYFASMAYDEISGKIILFGGAGEDIVLFNETWRFDGTTWVNHNLANPPSERYYAFMAYDGTMGKVILFGGADISGYFNDTWSLSASLTPLMPPSNLSGVQRKNDFGLCYELSTILKWKASLSNVSGYNVYKNGVKIATLDPTAIQYADHNNAKDTRISYSVTAFNSSGAESSPISIIIQ